MIEIREVNLDLKKKWKNLSNLNGRFTKMIEIKEVNLDLKKEMKKFIKFK